ncbi:MAG: flagellar basal body P-ring formation protein FlgA [Gammaproteobacteria bacterium]|nr:flagellar basal body P-ring formation protein FlgA [Gammaproteobacteria bacterium]
MKRTCKISRPKRHTLATAWASTLALMLTAPLTIASLQPPEPLREAARQFLQQQLPTVIAEDVELSIGRLDPRLRLTLCQNKPTAFLPPGARLRGKLTVGLRCDSPKPWTIYIQASIRIFSDVVAAAYPLRRGTQITAADLIIVRQETTNRLQGYFSKSKNVIGKMLDRGMNAGQLFTPRRLSPPLLVRRGDKVTIFASLGGLKVRVNGTALKDAARGQKLSVRNTRSKRIIQAIAVDPGIVQVRM